MQSFPLTWVSGHPFATIEGHVWLVDTGAPASFGKSRTLSIENRDIHLPDNYMGLTANMLTSFVGHSTAGIIGADILGIFDILFDTQKGHISFSDARLELDGNVIETEDFMGIPVILADIGGITRRMFFDSGAQLSYFQDDSLAAFPADGTITDFYPGFGQFQTDVHLLEATIGKSRHTLRCGSLPALLGMTLMMADTEGIIGNELLQNRAAGFFPRRRQLVIA